MLQICGRIAQLGEHLPYKQRVIGSSPIVPTTFLFGKRCIKAVGFDEHLKNDGEGCSVTLLFKDCRDGTEFIAYYKRRRKKA